MIDLSTSLRRLSVVWARYPQRFSEGLSSRTVSDRRTAPHPSTMPLEKSLKHAREFRMPSFGGLLSVTEIAGSRGRANDKPYRLLVQGLRHRQASPYLASRKGNARENSQD